MNAKRTRNYYDMFAIMFNSQKSYQKYIENTHLGLLTETHEYYFGSLKHQIFIYSRWRHPPKTISPRPYCRSRRGRNGLGSETTFFSAFVLRNYTGIITGIITQHSLSAIVLLDLI